MIPVDSPYFKRKLYRFEPMLPERIQTIRDSKLWLSMAKQFNDPFDSHPVISEPYYLPESFKKVLQIQKDAHKSSMAWSLLKPPANPCIDDNGLLKPRNWLLSVEENLRSVAICCFCENWNNHQLWSYYAQSHKGICLEYEVNLGTLLENGSKNIFQPINYASHYPNVEFADLLESRDPLDKISSLLLTKNLSWSHENEWRLIMFEEKGGKTIGMPEGIELKSILAGCEMPQEDYNTLQLICRDIDIECEQLTKDRRRSRLSRPSIKDKELLWDVIRR